MEQFLGANCTFGSVKQRRWLKLVIATLACLGSITSCTSNSDEDAQDAVGGETDGGGGAADAEAEADGGEVSDVEADGGEGDALAVPNWNAQTCEEQLAVLEFCWSGYPAPNYEEPQYNEQCVSAVHDCMYDPEALSPAMLYVEGSEKYACTGACLSLYYCGWKHLDELWADPATDHGSCASQSGPSEYLIDGQPLPYGSFEKSVGVNLCYNGVIMQCFVCFSDEHCTPPATCSLQWGNLMMCWPQTP